MSRELFALVYLGYGLAFFSMGLVVTLEWQRATDQRLRHALRPLAVFGIIHGLHEWQEMLQSLGALPCVDLLGPCWESLRQMLLAFSFLSLAAFGASLLAPTPKWQRLSLLLPLAQGAIWATGLLIIGGRLEQGSIALYDVADVWTRYVLGIPASIIASIGLVAQQRAFRRAGMAQFGRDALWAAVALSWYGLIGQIFTRASSLPPSTFINQALFLELFGFPVQVLRAGAAAIASLFIIRFLQAFEVDTQRTIAALQTARLREAERRHRMQRELLRRIVTAQEAERQRIARELHDETGQALTAIGLGLRGVSTTIQQDAERGASRLRQLEELVDRSLEELQRLISDLRPSQLDDLGLPSALRWLASEIKQRAKLDVDVLIHGKPQELAGPVRLTLFRVVQEALTNVVKHADATYTEVALHYGESQILVQVSDNGRGFNPAPILSEPENGRPSWGLIGIRERAVLLNGTCEIESQLDRGTVISVTIPYHDQTPAEDTPGPDDS